jgi:hypothetical protein
VLATSSVEKVEGAVSAIEGVPAEEEMGSDSEEPLTAAVERAGVERAGDASPVEARSKLRRVPMVGVTATSWSVPADAGTAAAGVGPLKDVGASDTLDADANEGVSGSCLISRLTWVGVTAAALAALACLITLWSTVN